MDLKLQAIQGNLQLTRREALRRIGAAAAGIAAFSIDAAHAQSATTAPVGNGAPLIDLGMELSAQQRMAGIEFLNRHVTVDTHCHPGRFFLKGVVDPSPTTRAFGQPFEEAAIEDLGAGNVSAGVFSAVADMSLLEQTATQGLKAGRDFKGGEAYADYQRQVAELKSLIESHAVAAGLNPADIESAHRYHKTAAIIGVEGGDFIEDRLDRVEQAFRDGVRVVTLVHYHINQIGDIQTESPVHRGLTPLGKTIVREMNRTGMVMDLAHATLAVTKGVLAASRKPIMISHTNLATRAVAHPRLITAEHAKMVAGAGGIIGSWPSGIGNNNFAEYIDSIRRLIDAVGVDHVAIGTDMDANFKPVLRSYRDWGLIPSALLARGLHEEEVAKIMGGNFLRVFKANL
jgi:membrane dipeptidase